MQQQQKSLKSMQILQKKMQKKHINKTQKKILKKNEKIRKMLSCSMAPYSLQLWSNWKPKTIDSMDSEGAGLPPKYDNAGTYSGKLAGVKS